MTIKKHRRTFSVNYGYSNSLDSKKHATTLRAESTLIPKDFNVADLIGNVSSRNRLSGTIRGSSKAIFKLDLTNKNLSKSNSTFFTNVISSALGRGVDSNRRIATTEANEQDTQDVYLETSRKKDRVFKNNTNHSKSIGLNILGNTTHQSSDQIVPSYYQKTLGHSLS